ncbi:MAG TPA: hypothetical protein VK781_03420 [Solirubrobacteraceae bacterium]|jgi:hypothetical protein|nr:hypothetical protein [Solirubrobacteraceae bacterium]
MSDFHHDCKQQLLTAAGTLFHSVEAQAPIQRHSRRLPVLAAVAIGALLLAAAAFAASQIIGVGASVKPFGGSERSSLSTGVGVPLPGSHRRLRSASSPAMSVPDPLGGLPWGMRIVTTTRGLLCVQVGRLRDGLLGVLGQDGRFKNDGLFHELPPGALDQSTCSQRDLFTLYRASGPSALSTLPGEVRSCSVRSSRRAGAAGQPVCPARDERLIAFGLLGPHAVSVSYRAGNRLHTVATSGSHGAYLIVLPPSAWQASASEDFSAANLTPSEGLPAGVLRAYLLSRVVFRDGNHRCQAGPELQIGGPPICGASMTGAPSIPSRGARRSPVALLARKRAGGYALTLAFTAPAAVHDANTAYGAEYTLEGAAPCEPGGAGQPIERDIKPGQRVQVTMFVNQKPGCHGVIHGRIVLGRQGSALSGPTYDKRTVGRFSFALP